MDMLGCSGNKLGCSENKLSYNGSMFGHNGFVEWKSASTRYNNENTYE